MYLIFDVYDDALSLRLSDDLASALSKILFRSLLPISHVFGASISAGIWPISDSDITALQKTFTLWSGKIHWHCCAPHDRLVQTWSENPPCFDISRKQGDHAKPNLTLTIILEDPVPRTQSFWMLQT